MKNVRATVLMVTLSIWCVVAAQMVLANEMVVTESGNVGIGTSAPGTKLEIVGGPETWMRLTGDRQNAWNTSGILLGDIINPNRYHFSVRGTKESDNANFRMYYHTRDPNRWWEVLSVLPLSLNSPEYNLAFHDNAMTIQHDGNVGIGTGSPGAKLQVHANELHDGVVMSSDTSFIKYMPGTMDHLSYNDLSRSGDNGIIFFNGNMVIGPWSPDANGIKIMADGNVGVGTATPAGKLDVAGLVKSHGVTLTSDARWKENVHPIEDALDLVSKIRGVTYEWADTSKGEGRQLGVIAQEVEEVFPEVVHTDSQGYKSVEYSKLVAPLIEAVKALKEENDEMRSRCLELEARIAAIESGKSKQ